MRFAAAAIAIALSITQPALACSCGGLRPFAAGIGAPSIILVGTVREYLRMPHTSRPAAMSVEVESTLSGTYRASRIVIWGDLGMSCVPYVTLFPIGTRWVFAVHGPTAIEDFGDENYHFGPCETDWLMTLDNNAVGLIDQGWMSALGIEQELPLAELKQWLVNRSAPVTPRRAFATLPRIGDGVDTPQIIEKAELHTPANCSYEATSVDVDLVVDSSGAIRSMRMPPRAPACLYSVVQDALTRWKLGPPLRRGKPVSAWFRVSFAVTR